MLPVDRGPAPFTASRSTDRFLFVFKGLRLGKATFFAHGTGLGESSFADRAGVFGRSISCQWGEEFMPSIARRAVRTMLVR